MKAVLFVFSELQIAYNGSEHCMYMITLVKDYRVLYYLLKHCKSITAGQRGLSLGLGKNPCYR